MCPPWAGLVLIVHSSYLVPCTGTEYYIVITSRQHVADALLYNSQGNIGVGGAGIVKRGLQQKDVARGYVGGT